MKRKQKTKISLKDALKQVNAEFIRRNKHEIWKLPNGRIMAISTTSSDNYFEAVNVRLIEKLMGIKF